jgi:CBS domain-containing protein
LLSDTTLDRVAQMMVKNNCGEIPIVDRGNRPIGVVTDRDYRLPRRRRRKEPDRDRPPKRS